MSCRTYVLGCLLLLTCGGCQNTSTPAAKTVQAGGAALTDVTLALNWLPEAEHGGYYAALVHGFYQEEGLNVTIRPGGRNVQVIADVATGKVDFGVDNADKLILIRAQEADVVAVMSPIQDSPRCIMVHQSSGLQQLEQLADRKPFTLAMNPGQPFAQYMMKRLKNDALQVVPYQGGVSQFLEDKNFGQQAYSFSEPYLASKLGGDPLCLMLSGIGFNTYTSALMVRRELIEKQPDLVSRVTRASIRGWKKYLAEPQQANQKIHELNSEMSPEILEFGVIALRPLCLPSGFDEQNLGAMTGERWQTLVDQMVEAGSIKPGSAPPEQAYDLKFLESK